MERLLTILAPALVLILIIGRADGYESTDSNAGARFAVGEETRAFADPERRHWQNTGPRPVPTIVWYPTEARPKNRATGERNAPNAPFVVKSVIPQAPISDAAKKYPLLLLSHGASGQARALLWFGHYFAERGYIVASVTHHGDTSTESDRPPQGRLHFWERPGDVSAALDALLTDPQFGPRIDAERIGAAGYSAGGGTVIQLAGAVFKPEELDALCTADPKRPGCEAPPWVKEQLERIKALANEDPNLRASLDRRSRSFKDHRIKAVFAMAPALGRIFTEQGLSTVNIPVAIVASRADQVTPLDLDAQPYVRSIRSARLTVVSDNASHFAFGVECTPFGQQTIDICREAPGVDRAALHRSVGALAHEFFEDVSRRSK